MGLVAEDGSKNVTSITSRLQSLSVPLETSSTALSPVINREGAGMREQGWRSGESARLPPMCPGFDSWTRRPMWVEFVVGSLLCSEGFSPGTPVFPPPQKQTLLNSNSIWKQWMKSHLVEMPLQIRNYYYYYYYYYLLLLLFSVAPELSYTAQEHMRYALVL